MYIFARLLALTVHVVQLFNVANGTKNVGTLSGTSISRQAGWHKLCRHGVRGGGLRSLVVELDDHNRVYQPHTPGDAGGLLSHLLR